MSRAKSVANPVTESGGFVPNDSIQKRIVAEARQRFFSLGIRRVTMDDLAYDLGMSKRTIYQYFRTKADLVEAVFLDKLQNVEADLTQVSAESSSDFLGAMNRLLACIQRHMEELQPALVRDIRRDAPDIFSLVENHRKEMIDRHLGKILRDGCKAGVIRNDVSVDLIMELVLAAVQAIMNPEKLTELKLSPKEGFVAILTVIFQGAMRAEGRATS